MSQYSKGSFFVAAAYISLMVCQAIYANASELPSSNPVSANANNIVAMTNQNNQGAGQSLAVKIASKIKNQLDQSVKAPHPVAKQSTSVKVGQKITAQPNTESSQKFAVKRQIPNRGKMGQQATKTPNQVAKSAIDAVKSAPSIKGNNPSAAVQVTNKAAQKVTTIIEPVTTTAIQKDSKSSGPTTDIARVASYYKSTPGKTPTPSKEKMRIYSSPDQKAKVVTEIGVTDNFTVHQGDWVRVKDSAGKEGWALISDVESNINEAWNAEFQVIINGPSSNYSVSKISPEERKQRQQKLRQAQVDRMQKLAKLWESEFFSFNDDIGDNQADQINDLKKQVVALNEQINSINKQQATQKKA